MMREDELRKVEMDLMAALERLRRKRRNGRPVRISYSAVALEAGKSRTLVGHKDCPYPNVREAIGEAIRSQKATVVRDWPVTDTNETSTINDKDRYEPEEALLDPVVMIARLKREVEFLKKQCHLAAVKIVTIDDENQQLRDKIVSLTSKLKRSGST